MLRDDVVIEGLKVTPLKQIKDPRGDIFHMLRADSQHYKQFGEVYFSFINPGSVKAWKRHLVMEQNFAVPIGMIQLVVCKMANDGETVQTQLIDLGVSNYALVTIPPNVWYGFKGVSKDPAMIANCATVPHDPDECETKSPDDPVFNYEW